MAFNAAGGEKTIGAYFARLARLQDGIPAVGIETAAIAADLGRCAREPWLSAFLAPLRSAVVTDGREVGNTALETIDGVGIIRPCNAEGRNGVLENHVAFPLLIVAAKDRFFAGIPLEIRGGGDDRERGIATNVSRKSGKTGEGRVGGGKLGARLTGSRFAPFANRMVAAEFDFFAESRGRRSRTKGVIPVPVRLLLIAEERGGGIWIAREAKGIEVAIYDISERWDDARRAEI